MSNHLIIKFGLIIFSLPFMLTGTGLCAQDALERRAENHEQTRSKTSGQVIDEQDDYSKINLDTNTLQKVGQSIMIATRFLELSHSDSAIFYINQTLELLDTSNMTMMSEERITTIDLMVILGEAYMQKSELDKAQETFINVYKMQRKIYGDVHPKIARTISCLSEVYYHQGKSVLAKEYAMRALSIQDQTLPAIHLDRVRPLTILGRRYLWQKKYAESSEQFEEANLIVRLSLGDHHPQLAMAQQNLGKLAMVTQQWDLAEQYYSQSLNVLKNTFGNFHVNTARMFSNLGTLYSEQSQHRRAINYFDSAALVYDSLYGINNAGSVDVHMFKAESFILLNDFESARHSMELSAQSAKFDIDNPTKFEGVHFLSRIIKWNSILSHLYENKYRITNQSADSDSLLLVQQQQLALFDYLFQNATNDDDRSSLAQQEIRYVQLAMEHLVRRNRSDELRYAFELAEKGKSRFLKNHVLDVINSKKLLPDRIHQDEIGLTTEINYNQKLLHNELNDKTRPNLKLVRKYKDNLFRLRRHRDRFLDNIKRDYPMYDLLKHNPKIVQVAEIQSLLKSDESLVEYYVSDSTGVFIFVISKHSLVVEVVDLDFSLLERITSFRNSIFSYWVEPGASDSMYRLHHKNYIRLGHELYNKLIAPVKEHLNRKLIVIPDRALHLLPFDALLSAEIGDSMNDYRQFPYLVLDHQISFCPSATLYQALVKNSTRSKGNKLLAVAPRFSKSDESANDIRELKEDLGPLQWNIEEVKKINKTFPAKLLMGDQAVKKEFLRLSPRYNFLHLATHGKSNDTEGNFSFVAFTKDAGSSTGDNRLYVSELFGLELKAEMVTLSACETGLGQVKKGQGLLGLAYGFFNAGARSVITSLWKVDDQQASVLMPRFYEYLSAGWEKDAALRRAKLDFIDEEEVVHPYYWASFIASGNMEPIVLESNRIGYWLLALLGLVLLVGLVMRSNSKSSK